MFCEFKEKIQRRPTLQGISALVSSVLVSLTSVLGVCPHRYVHRKTLMGLGFSRFAALCL